MPKRQVQSVETAFTQYELIDVIGEGGAGRVWRAKDSSGAEVAIKVLSAERVTQERRKRFKNEILFCERAQHPSIIRVLDHGVASHLAGAPPFYVMPLLQASFRAQIRNTSDIAGKLRYFDQVLSGVEAAHLRNVIHRDLKPENVLYDQPRNLMVVADFGIAHFTDEELYTAVETKPDARLANFQYSAPEQRTRGRSTDFRTDLYSLGLILNEMITGEVPHGTGFKTVAAVAADWAWIDEVIAEMIQQDPGRRPVSVDAIKCQFIARKQDFIERQRLSKISETVVPVGEEDDPLALEPPKLVGVDWGNGQLTLILNRPVNHEWVQALFRMGTHSAVLGKGPDAFAFDGDRATVQARENEVQRIIDFFKTWLPITTDVYRDTRAQKRREAAERERWLLQREQAELEQRQRVRESVRL